MSDNIAVFRKYLKEKLHFAEKQSKTSANVYVKTGKLRDRYSAVRYRERVEVLREELEKFNELL